SSAAAVTGRNAVELRDNTAALNQSVEELRRSVIKVVRDSTADVDRRQFHRYAVDLAAELSIDGRGDCRVQVSDLSERGACVRGAPEVPVGTSGRLCLNGVAAALLWVARANDPDGLHLAFTQDAAAAPVRLLLDRLEMREAA